MSNEHKCTYIHKKGDVYECSSCMNQHICTTDTCEYLFYNTDCTRVCYITGLCFNQHVCDTYVDATSPLQNEDNIYIKKIKRDQQIKNRSLTASYVFTLLKSLSKIVLLSDREMSSLTYQIIELWKEFVMCTQEKQNYTYRKDKRCFIIAIAVSLNRGLVTNTGQQIVRRHKSIIIKKLNKKSKYEKFKVADIRCGTNLITKIFKDIFIDESKTIDINNN